MSNEEQVMQIAQSMQPELLRKKLEFIGILKDLDCIAWAHGFCSNESSLDPHKMMVALLQLEDKDLPHIGILSLLLKTISPTIDEHMRTLKSKRSRLIHTDEYGDINTKKWFSELKKYYKEKIEFILNSLTHEISDDIFEGFSVTREEFWIWTIMYNDMVTGSILRTIDFYISTQYSSTTDDEPPPKMSGLEYEIYIANMINSETRWSAEVTKSTGDQGADLIITKGPITAVIQTKNYSEKVGNKAVQEAFSAKRFYNADLGFVVSNSEFTNSARELSERTGIQILSELELIEFLK